MGPKSQRTICAERRRRRPSSGRAAHCRWRGGRSRRRRPPSPQLPPPPLPFHIAYWLPALRLPFLSVKQAWGSLARQCELQTQRLLCSWLTWWILMSITWSLPLPPGGRIGQYFRFKVERVQHIIQQRSRFMICYRSSPVVT